MNGKVNEWREKIQRLETMTDVINVVNEENIQDFLEDFGSWLYLRVQIKKANSTTLGKVIETEPYFKWIDDKKHDATIKIKSVWGEK